MDYKKINEIKTDGDGNIVLQDVNANNVTINQNKPEELEKVVDKLNKMQLEKIQILIGGVGKDTETLVAIIHKELDSRKRKTKILSIALVLLGISVVVTTSLAFWQYNQEFGFAVKLKSIQNVEITEGQLTATLFGKEFKTEITKNGDAVFSNIPPQYKNDEVKFSLYHPLHAVTFPDSVFVLEPNTNYILPCAYKNLHRVFGVVKDEDNLPVEGVTVTIAEQSAITNALGKFEIQIPTDKQQPEQRLVAFKHGYQLWDRRITIDATHETGLILRK